MVVAVTTQEKLVANTRQHILKYVYFQQYRECGILLHIYTQTCGYHQETDTPMTIFAEKRKANTRKGDFLNPRLSEFSTVYTRRGGGDREAHGPVTVSIQLTSLRICSALNSFYQVPIFLIENLFLYLSV